MFSAHAAFVLSFFSAFIRFAELGVIEDFITGGIPVGDFYVAENGTDFYVTEDGLNNYVIE